MPYPKRGATCTRDALCADSAFASQFRSRSGRFSTLARRARLTAQRLADAEAVKVAFCVHLA
jgi:hypothetical protein